MSIARRWLETGPGSIINRHALPVAALALLHVCVFAKLIFAHDGVPYAVVPWDFRTISYPWLAYLSDGIHAGHFPLWCPYSAAGTPFFANGANMVYSPVTLLFATLFGYSIRGLQLQLVAMIFVGGLGAYALAYRLWRSRSAALVAGLCFGFSSGVLSDMEAVMVINDFVVAPWLVWTTLAMFEETASWPKPLLVLLIFFALAAGYPFVAIMELAWLAACTACLLWRMPKRLRARQAVDIIIAWGLGGAMAAVDWLPLLASQSESTRNVPLKLEAALSNGLTFKYLWGVLFHFLVVVPLPGSAADLTLRGVYFGAVALPLVGVALLSPVAPRVKVIAGLVIGTMLMSVPAQSFLRIALHIIVPFLNLSRQPGYDSRTWMVLGLVTLAALGARRLAVDMPGARVLFIRGCQLLLVLQLAGFAIFHGLVAPEQYSDVVLDSLSAEVIFIGLAIFAAARLKGRQLIAAICVSLALELGMSVVVNFGVIGAPMDAASYRALSERVKIFSTQGTGEPRLTNSMADLKGDDVQSLPAFTRKQFYLTQYSGFHLRRFEHLLDSGFAPFLVTGRRVVALAAGADVHSFAEFEAANTKVDYGILSYVPDEVSYRVRAERPERLVFNEMYFPGWRASVDGGPWQPMLLVADGLRAIDISSGEHLVRTQFHPLSFRLGLTISGFAMLSLLGWILLLRRRSERERADHESGATPPCVAEPAGV